MRAILALEDGLTFTGRSFTGNGESSGEVIFNTGMTGYQEVLTDPSYTGQMVAMTYPLVGNYGVNLEDVESSRVRVAAFIVKECCKVPSSWRSAMSFARVFAKARRAGHRGYRYAGAHAASAAARRQARHHFHGGDGRRQTRAPRSGTAPHGGV